MTQKILIVEKNGQAAEYEMTPQEGINPSTGQPNPELISGELPSEAQSASKDQLQGYVSQFNHFFKDDLGFKIGNRFFIATFASGMPLPDLNQIDYVALSDKPAEKGEALWVDDEEAGATYKANLEIDFGYGTEKGWKGVDQGSSELTKLTKKAEKALHLEDHVLTESEYNSFQTDFENLKIHLSKKTSFISDPRVGTNAQGEIVVNFQLTPRAKEIIPQIIYADPTGKTLSNGEKTALRERFKEYFKEPCDFVSLQKGLKKIRRDFEKKSADYLVATWQEGMDPRQKETQELMPSFTPSGNLVVPIVITPLTRSITLNVEKLDQNGSSLSQSSLNPANLGLELHYPLNLVNLAKNADIIEKYYAGLGYLCLKGDKKGAQSPTSTELAIKIIPVPQRINFRGNAGPKAQEIERMFNDPDFPHITTSSMEKGLQKLSYWFENKGFKLNRLKHPRSGKMENIIVDFKDGEMTIDCQAVKFGTLQIFGADAETIEWLKEHEADLRREFPTKKGEFINLNDYREALARITEYYPLEVKSESFEINNQNSPDNPTDDTIAMSSDGEGTMRLSLSLINYKRDKEGAVHGYANHFGGEVGGDNTGLKTGFGYDHRTNDGQRLDADISVSGMPKYTTLGTGASYTIPWINKGGASMDLHGGVSWLPWYNSYNSQSVGVGFSQPIGGPHSSWSFIYGMDFERIESLVNSPDFWAKPSAGIRYQKNGWTIEIKAGPRLSIINGAVYGEISIKATKKHYLTHNHRLYLKAQAEAGLRVGSNPFDLTSLSMLKWGPFQAYAKVRAGILYRFKAPKKGLPEVALGFGVGATTFDAFTGTPSIWFGPWIETTGIDLLFGPSFNPVLGGLAFSMG